MAENSVAETSVTGDPVARLSGRVGWAMFDWANQPYFTLIITFIFAPYFVAHVVGDPVKGQAYWGYGQAAAGLIIALMSPVLGAVADAGGARKPWIYAFQTMLVLAAASLWFAVPGADATTIVWILGAVVIASIGAEFSIVFNNAMLPTLVPESRLGRLSGFGWCMGYVGGLIALFIILLGFSLPETPMFGIDKASHQQDRMTGPFTAIWLLLFLIPFFMFTPDAGGSGLRRADAIKQGLKDLKATLKRAAHYRNLLQFLIARMLYQDGMSAIFAFGGVYAVGIFGWDITSLGIFGIILTICAGIGAYAGGIIDDRLGSKRTVIVAVIGLIIGTLGVLSVTTSDLGNGMRLDTILFFMHSEITVDPEAGLFSTPAEIGFMIFGILIGVCGGPVQSASRAMVSRLAPPAEIGRFYGLYALVGKATAFLAPFCIAGVTLLFNSQRVGIGVVIVFLVVGLLVFLPVREQRTESPN